MQAYKVMKARIHSIEIETLRLNAEETEGEKNVDIYEKMLLNSIEHRDQTNGNLYEQVKLFTTVEMQYQELDSCVRSFSSRYLDDCQKLSLEKILRLLF